MQENEFEREIKKRMEAFTHAPSAASWEKINEKLRQKKRRKAPFIFLLMFALLAAGILIFNPFTKKDQFTKTIVSNNKTSIKKSLPVDSTNAGAQQQIITQQRIQTEKIYTKTAIKNLNKQPVTNAEQEEILYHLKSKNGLVIKNENNNGDESKSGIVINNNPAVNETKSAIASQQPDSLHGLISVNKAGDEKSKYRTDTTNTIDVSNNQSSNKKDSVTADISSLNKPVDSSENSLVVTKLSTKIKLVNKAIPKWQFGVTASFGNNSTIEGLTNINKSYAVASLNSPGMLARVDSTQTNIIYKSSNAYHIGFVAQRRIIKNGFISTGLNFVHLETKSTVSSKIPSPNSVQFNSADNQSFSITGYFKPSASSTTTNRYNFIELPVLFQQDFWPLNKVSLSYNAGATLRQLVNSQSLIYSETNNIYFSKNSLLSKTQVQLAAGLSLKFNAGKNASVYVGPQLSYSLTSLFKDNYNPNFHFINYGLQASLLLHKK